MTRISKIKLHKNQLKEITSHFSYLIFYLRDLSEIENFINNFLTPEEKIMLTKRLVLFMMIKKGYSPPVIQSALHLSYESVRDHSNQLSFRNDKFQKTIDRLIKRERTMRFFKKIDRVLKLVGILIRSKSNMKARAKLASGDWS